ncbi:hypothetical protein BJX70DRAFT_222680 [Aspergillus crustosus]
MESLEDITSNDLTSFLPDMYCYGNDYWAGWVARWSLRITPWPYFLLFSAHFFSFLFPVCWHSINSVSIFAMEGFFFCLSLRRILYPIPRVR